MINFHQTQFLTSAERFSQCPIDVGCEVAFAGCSNAGKSSVINMLTQQRKLARVSKTPGRTQLINFFSVSESQRLVDLPGYGYAKVPVHVQQRWEEEMENYFHQRRSLVGLVIIMDVRHPMKPFDMAMLDFAQSRQLNTHVLLNKADKFKFGAAKTQWLKVNDALKRYSSYQNVSSQLFSALRGTGLDQLQEQLDHWLDDCAVDASVME